MKTCPACSEDLPDTAFYVSPSRRGGGLSYRCKLCEREHRLEYWHARPKPSTNVAPCPSADLAVAMGYLR